MSNAIGNCATAASPCRLLRMEKAASDLALSLRAVRYHARKRKWQKVRGLVREADVKELKTLVLSQNAGDDE